MAVKSILTSQTDFTGEFPYIDGMSGLWRFNESAPDADNMLLDSSGNDRKKPPVEPPTPTMPQSCG